MKPAVAVIMGSKSDWETMKECCLILDELAIPYQKKVVSAHRTPDLMFEFAETARAEGIKVIVAGAGGAAHLPGMVAAKTTLPVIGVPVQSRALNGLDSLYPSCKCRVVYQWQQQRSEKLAQLTQDYLQRRCFPCMI